MNTIRRVKLILRILLMWVRARGCCSSDCSKPDCQSPNQPTLSIIVLMNTRKFMGE